MISFDTYMRSEPGALHVRLSIPVVVWPYSTKYAALIDREWVERCASCHTDIWYDPMATLHAPTEVLICIRCLARTTRLRRRDAGVVSDTINVLAAPWLRAEAKQRGLRLPLGTVRPEGLTYMGQRVMA